MRVRHIATGVALLALAACGTSEDPDPKGPAPATTHAKLSRADAMERCTDAVADLATGQDEAPSEEDLPKVCARLSDADRLDAYADGLAEANQRARDAM